MLFNISQKTTQNIIYKKYIQVICIALISIVNTHCQLHISDEKPNLQTRKNILQDNINLVLGQTDYCKTHALNINDIAQKTQGFTNNQLNRIIILSLAAAKKLQTSLAYEHIIWALYSLTMESKNESILNKVVSIDFLTKHSEILRQLVLTIPNVQQSIATHAPKTFVAASKVIAAVCSSSIAYHLVCAMPLITLGYCVFDTIREQHFSVDKNIFYSIEYQLLQRIAQEEQTILQQNIQTLDQQIKQMKERIEQQRRHQTLVNKLIESNTASIEDGEISLSSEKEYAAIAQIIQESNTMSLETILRIARECNAHQQ